MKKTWLTSISLMSLLLAVILSPLSYGHNSQLSHKATATITGVDKKVGQRRNIDNLYMVLLNDEPLATYSNNNNPTASSSINRVNNALPRVKSRLNVNSSASKSYLNHLELKRKQMLTYIKGVMKLDVVPEKTYQYALNGFTARLTPADAIQLKANANIKSVIKVTTRSIRSDTGAEFIKATTVWEKPIQSQSTKGEGVIVAIFDTGITPEHPSFAAVGDDGFNHTNPLGDGVYLGACRQAEYVGYCNNKLIGIWSVPEITNTNTANGSPIIGVGIDYEGHGTHTASTAAGNILYSVPIINFANTSLLDTSLHFPQISGVAPHANIVAYQVCSANGDCYPDVTAEAVEHAIANNIDVINFSIGGDALDPWGQIDSLAFLSARAAGIHVAASAGNEGPVSETISAPGNAPWLTSVAAISHGREFSQAKDVSFSGGSFNLGTISGLGFTEGVNNRDIVYAGDYGDKDCLTAFTPQTFNGEIVVCVRNDIPRVDKGANVLAGGAGGLVLINDTNDAGTNDIVADYHALPAIHITAENGARLIDWLKSGNNHQATISTTSIEKNTGNVVADFSSRGPEPILNQWLVPNVAAPGINVYAANTAQQDDSIEIKLESDFRFLSGTSMASPHVAGAFALIHGVKPSWTPAEAQSALMLTAQFDSTKEVSGNNVKAHFFDVGAGRIDVDKAINSGLVMKVTEAQYLAADPDKGGDATTLNLPSMLKTNCPITCTWQRTFTATADSSWQAEAENLSSGFSIAITPNQFSLQQGQSIELTISATINSAFTDDVGIGRVRLTPSSNNVSSVALPVLGQFLAGQIADEIKIIADSNQGSHKVRGISTIGTSQLVVEVSGLAEIKEKIVTLSRANTVNTNWPNNVINNPSQLHTEIVNIPSNTKLFSIKINNTQSPDLDLYVGIDSDRNGRINASEMRDVICESATQTALEHCEIFDPAAGQYYIGIHNFGSDKQVVNRSDTIDFQWSVVGENNGELSVEYDPQALAQQDIDLTLAWQANMGSNQRYLTLLSIGTSPDEPINVGLIPVEIERSGNFIQTDIDKETIVVGEDFTIFLELEANNSSSTRSADITLTLPVGASVVSDNQQGSLNDNQLTWQLSQASNSQSTKIEVVIRSDENGSSTRTNLLLNYRLTGGGIADFSMSQSIATLTITAADGSVALTTSGSSSGGSFGWFIVTLLLYCRALRYKSDSE